MIVDRVFTPGLAQVAYLIADESTGDVAVIDPRRDVQVYLDWAAERNFRISAILETHVHADFVSGAVELHRVTGAPIFASALGNQEFDYEPLRDGSRVPVGRLVLEARWTPGHTPEHVAFLLFDPDSSDAPQAMFSGDLIFAGEVGRPDLLGEAHTGQLALQLFETLTQRIADLPDELLVYPGHTAGSACGRKIGDAATTTLGEERAGTYAWQFTDAKAFVEGIMDEMPAPPPYYPRMKVVNRVGPALLADLPEGTALSAERVSSAIADGAVVIDARQEQSFDRAHIRGSFYAGSVPTSSRGSVGERPTIGRSSWCSMTMPTSRHSSRSCAALVSTRGWTSWRVVSIPGSPAAETSIASKCSPRQSSSR
ncbi:MAG: MBL fold metallo-hydrolase [Thermomicrobiales bacterium]